MVRALAAGDLCGIGPLWPPLALAITALGRAACGDSGAPDPAPNPYRFLMRQGEEPGFRPGALPGAMPRTRRTITGIEAFVNEFHLTQADAQRLRKDGFVSTSSGPIRGPRTAGIT